MRRETTLALTTDAVEKTQQVGEELGRLLEPGDLICVYGPLGAGKTALAQGVARGLGVTEAVVSPTFILIREYRGRVPFYHFDAYRLHGPADLNLLGAEEYLAGDGVVLVEWADRVDPALPAERLDIVLDYGGENKRRLSFVPRGARYRALVEELKRKL
ncbi:MAG: tRNA (adenosine(37)-N6)-threonylcarbamoyltransferase complex ATPase subunit type 1 TsaE [Bacillota bacterium]